MRPQKSLLFILLLSIFILFFSVLIPITDTSLVYADGGGGGGLPPPEDTTGNNSIIDPDSTIVVSDSDNEISLLDIFKLIIFTL